MQRDEDHYNTVDARGEVTGAGIATLQTIPDAPPGSVYLLAMLIMHLLVPNIRRVDLVAAAA